MSLVFHMNTFFANQFPFQIYILLERLHHTIFYGIALFSGKF